jgi:parvulin-like peptidyl-prolyl isomerase
MQRLFGTAAILLLATALGGWTAGAAASWESLFDDPVLARGTNVLVKRSQLDEAFIAYKSNLAGRGQPIPEEERLLRERLLLDRLLLVQILTNRAAPADKVRAHEIATNLLARTEGGVGSQEALARRLKVLGISGERYTNQVAEQALAQAVVEREVRSKVQVSNEDVDDFYQTGTDVVVRALQAELERLAKDPATSANRLAEVKKQVDAVKQANLSRLEQPEQVRVSHVMLSTRDKNTDIPLSDEQKKLKRAQIDKLRVAAVAGEDFQKLIADYSEDRNLKANKGEYLLSRDSPFLPEFKAAAFALGPGQISEVLTTGFGFHILKVSERLPPKKVPIEEVRNVVREMLTEQELQRRLPDFYRKLRQEANVEVLDPKYRTEAPPDANPLKD